MVTVILTVVLAVLGYSLLVLLAVAVLCRSHVREPWKSWRHRGEVADGPDYYDTDDGVSPQMRQARDDLMDVADVVAESFDRAEQAVNAAFDRLGPPPGWTPGGLTEADVATLRRNRLHLTDAERYELDLTFLSIVNPNEVPE